MKHLYRPIRFLLAISAAISLAAAQMAPNQPSGLSMDELTSRAGIIFSGTVQEVEATEGAVIHVTFTVDEGIRGAFSGQTITINEWKKSATAVTRYRAGEKLLIFFHAPTANGLTSPVGGDSGILRFADTENLTLSEEQANALKRSARLRHAMPIADPAARSIAAEDLVRALRLVISSQ